MEDVYYDYSYSDHAYYSMLLNDKIDKLNSFVRSRW